MAGSVTITYQDHRTVKWIQWAWTSDASGDVSGTETVVVSGQILRVVTIPDDTAAPTASYDVTLEDEDNVDILYGAGADRSATDAESLVPLQTDDKASPANVPIPVPFDGKLELKIVNAGNAKQGTVKLYYR